MAAATVKTPFTGDEAADRLLTDDGLALVVGMLLEPVQRRQHPQ